MRSVSLVSIAFIVSLGFASPTFSKEEPLPRSVVSEAQFKTGLAKLHGKAIGAPVASPNNIVCYKLNRIDYWVITGNNYRTGGIWCHN